MIKERALVLFSGGQDSATLLAWSLSNFGYVETLGFEYGQKHRVEMDVRGSFFEHLKKDYTRWGQKLGQDHVLDLKVLGEISETSLTSDMAFQYQENGLPNTFVPGRNLMFLTFAASIAYRRGLKHIVIGVCEADYSGYPDCRDDTIKAMQIALNLGFNERFVLHTPLMWIDKTEIWRMAEELGGLKFANLIAQETHSCYEGNRENLNEWGFGCGECPACKLRANGFMRYRYGIK